MTDRDKLIELVDKAKKEYAGDVTDHTETDYIVECLLNNGVILPPCKVGDDVYWIDNETNEIKCEKNDIKAVCYYGEGKFKVIVKCEDTPEDIGTKWCMLTKKQAEQKLKELKDNANKTE